MTLRLSLIACVFILIGMFSISFAQDDVIDIETCAAIFQSALINTDLECADSAEGDLCYGNLDVTPEFDADVEFEMVGSRISLVDVANVSVSPMDTTIGAWGVAQMRLDIVDSESPLTMIAFGGVEIENLSAGLVTQVVVVTSNTGAFVRELPSTDAEVLSPIQVGAEIIATGRLEDTSWIRVSLNDGRVGWVSARAISPQVDDSGLDVSFELLAIVESTDSPDRLFAPMQAFNFSSGETVAPCMFVPESGILFQSPDNVPAVLQVNDVVIEVKGTVFAQAINMDDAPVFNVLEGELTVLAENSSDDFTVSEGNQYTIVDGGVRPFSYARMEILPFELLPRDVLLPVDWLAVIVPAQENPLARLTIEDDCTVMVVNAVNVRVGPGREYEVRGSMLATQSAYPTGRAIGNDGRVWWRLTDGAWLSFDVTIVAGNCNDLPMIQVLPRP